ncbi:DNase I-like protein, partial [Hymenopellis radicata]
STNSSLSTVDTPPIASTSTAVSVAPKELPDILVLGFQELDLSTEALIYSTSTVREDAWCTAVFAALGEHQSEYTKLASKQLVGILIVVIVRKAIAHRFADVRTSVAGVGIMGGSGDDASESGGTVFTFVNSHLAAFDEMVDKRNSDFADLAKRLTFGLESGVTIWESDVVFWMGDLNYRVDQPDGDVRELLFEADQHRWARKKNLNALMAYDQLRNAMQSGQAFDHFSEHPITHPPCVYSVRKPAWTDRILNLVGPAVTLKQHTYTSHAQITMSDHRPVSADFTLETSIMRRHGLTTARSLYRQLQGLDLESRKVGVEPEEVSIGNVRYKQRITRTVRLRNDGKNPCVFRFVPPTPEGDISPPWLTLQPVTGILLPYQPLDVTLTINVDERTPHYMRDLDCTLVLHTGPGLGKDRFIVVEGDYQPSCIGIPLVNLTALPGPIRTTWGQSNSKQNLNAPREVMRLVNWMMDNRLIEAFTELEEETTGYDEEASVSELTSSLRASSLKSPEPSTSPTTSSIMTSPASASTLSKAGSVPASVMKTPPAPAPTLEDAASAVRECLDTNTAFPSGLPPQAYGMILLELLDNLVPEHVEIGDVYSREEAFEVLDAFPIVNVNVWISVTAFLHYIVQQEEDKARMIAAVLAPVVLRDSPATIVEKRRFVRYFIEA